MRLALILALTAIVSLPAVAQQTPPPRQVSPEAEVDQTTARFRLADNYLRAHQFDRAIAILEDLLADAPDSTPVANRLRDAYVGAMRYDDAIALVQGRIDQVGAQPGLIAELGTIHMARGDREAADRAWQDAIDAAPNQQQTYRILYSTLVQNRLWERARDVLLEARQRLRQPDLFHSELAELYSRTNQHAEALEEWAAFLGEDENRLSFVQGRISRLLDQEGAPTAFQQALDRLIRQDPMVLSFRRLAAWLAAETGNFEAGLDHMRAVDRLGDEQGQAVFAYAESALQAGALDAAERGFSLVLERHAQSSAGAAALLSSALLFERRGQQANERPEGDAQRAPNYAEASNRYNQFLETHAAHPAAPAAMRRLAELRRDVYKDYERAEELLNAVIRQYPDTDHAAEARLALGELAILQDNLSAARLAFAQVDSQVRIGDRADRARLALAELDFYEGNFEMALSRTNAMKRNTATDVSNNAIDLKLLLTENQGPDSLATPLRSFARSELRQRQRRPGEALELLDAILASYAGHPITPLVRFRRAHALRSLDRADEAVAELRQLPEDHPESYLADRALFLAAETIERNLRDPAAALEAYTAFLMHYPGSLLAAEARTRIRRLRGDLPS